MMDIKITCSGCSGHKIVRRWREDVTCGMCGGRGFIVIEVPSTGFPTLKNAIWEDHVNSRDEVIESVERILEQVTVSAK